MYKNDPSGKSTANHHHTHAKGKKMQVDMMKIVIDIEEALNNELSHMGNR